MSRKHACRYILFLLTFFFFLTTNAQNNIDNLYASNKQATTIKVDQSEKNATDANKDSAAPLDDSALTSRIRQTFKTYNSSFTLSYFESTYILPFYYTGSTSPYYATHPDSTPENTKIKPVEVKA